MGSRSYKNIDREKPATSWCAIYTRKSTDENLNSDFTSLDSQREYCQSFVKSREGEGWRVYPEEYNDPGFSGGNINRPGLRKLLHDARNGKFQVVVCYKYDRLSRNTKDFLHVLDIFDQNQVAFVSVTQPIDTTSSVGRLMRSILMDFSQFEREMIAERTRDKLYAMAQKGKRTGGRPIIGFDIQKDTKKILVNPEERKIVIEMFDTYTKTKSLSLTAEALNRKGYRMKEWISNDGRKMGGQEFNKANLWYLLRNPQYIGKISFRQKELPGEHEAIITEQTRAAALKLLQVNGNGKLHKEFQNRRHLFLLKGLVRCVCCNTSMTPTSARPRKEERFFYYKCLSVVKQNKSACQVRSVPAQAIEEFVLKKLEQLGEDKPLVEKIAERARLMAGNDLPVKRDQKKLVSAELGKVELEAKNLVSVLAEEGPQSSQRAFISERLDELATKRTECQTKLIGLDREIEGLEKRQIDADVIRQNLKNFMQVFRKLQDREKSEFINLLIHQVDYDGVSSKVRIGLRPLPEAWGDLDYLESVFDDRKSRLPASNADQAWPDERQTSPRISNGNQAQILKNFLLLASAARDDGSITLIDRCRVGYLRVAKGKSQIFYPMEAHAIKAHQRRYRTPPEPRPPTIQILLKQAYQLNKTLEENPDLTRTALAKRIRIEPSMLTRILNLLNLAPEIQAHILKMEPSIYQSPISERRLSHLARNKDHLFQMEGFKRLTVLRPRARVSSIQKIAQIELFSN